MKRDYIYIVIIAALLAVLFTTGKRAEREEVKIEAVRVDSAQFWEPEPTRVECATSKVTVPRWLFFAPERSENPGKVVEERTDSVEIDIRTESRVYRDSTYEATVSGPTIGGHGPKLDYIRTFNTTREITRTIYAAPRKRWEVMATASALYARGQGDIWAGLTVTRHVGRLTYGASAGYSLSGHPYAEARVGIALLRGER